MTARVIETKDVLGIAGAPMPFRITEPCDRLLETSHDPAEVIRRMCAGIHQGALWPAPYA
jgi:hypothetical protein